MTNVLKHANTFYREHSFSHRQSNAISGGPYCAFAGRDASRGLATFSVEPVSEDYDDLSDLKPHEMDQVKEWELQFSEKYTLVGESTCKIKTPSVSTERLRVRWYPGSRHEDELPFITNRGRPSSG